jgi:FMN-dependent oxidoreductase (nitrilotriacetate monooxygenase family)
MPRPEPMALALMLDGVGTHIAAWRHPQSALDRVLDVNHYKSIAQAAERAFYDLLFIADSLYVNVRASDAGRRYPRHGHLELDPMLLLSALSGATHSIGLASTVSTTYTYPYATARAFATLDHLSGGRAGWNVVTSHSDLEAKNYGVDAHPPHAERYARAAEYVDVVKRLWDSWEEDAVIADKASGVAIDLSKLHALNHKGAAYSVGGPLNITRPPQGHPVVIQAGSSGPGQDLAASIADVVFTAQETKAGALAFYRSIKDRLPGLGRRAEDVIVIPGVFAIVGETDAEAQAKFRDLQDLIDPVVGLQLLAHMIGEVDPATIDIDKPLPPLADSNASKSRLEMVRKMGADETVTVREIYARLAPARGHLNLVGSAEMVADTLQDWYDSEACDGFMLIPGLMTEAQDDFDRLVLPILRSRGVAKRAYAGSTLREHLGLPKPPNSFLTGTT